MSAKDNQLTIPQDIIDSAIDYADILQIIQADVKLKRSGRDYVGLCPFHKERSPSFTVSPNKQFYYCFGCGAGGNALEFTMDMHNRPFIDVIQEMAEAARLDLTPYLMIAQHDKRVMSLLPAIQAATQLFTSSLADRAQNPKAETAYQYLAQRQVTDELIERFNLGYAGYGPKIVETLHDHQVALIEAGILGRAEDSERVFSMFRNRVMLPIRNVKGKAVAVSGRALDPDDTPKYLNSKESNSFIKTNLLYGLYESLKAFGQNGVERIFVVEGQFDVIAHHMIELPAAGALGSSLSLQQLNLLRRYAKRVTFVFDGDKAGLKALVSSGALLLESLTDLDVTFDMVVLEEGDDPHELITTTPDVYLSKVENAKPWLDCLFENLASSQKLDTQEGKMAYANEAIDLIHQARDALLRYQALERVAENTGFPIKALEEKLEAIPPPRSGYAKSRSAPPKQTVNENAVRLTRMLWDTPTLSKNIEYPELWVQEGDELVQLLGTWAIQLKAGEFDASPEPDDQNTIQDGEPTGRRVAKKSTREGGVALARMLTQLAPQYMEQLMREAPETIQSVAVSLCWHITGICARKAMTGLQQKAGAGVITNEERATFVKLVSVNRNAINRSKSIDT